MRRGSGPRPVSESVVVVTGASSGIGRATAHALAGRGASVVLASRDGASLDEAATECEAAGGRALSVPTDVSDAKAVDELARRTVEHFGRIDVWVNAAAVMAYGRVEDIPLETFRGVLETNLLGTIHGARAVLPTFRAQGAGVLVDVASLYAKLTSPYVSPYVASKYGVLGFTRCLREELADQREIHVCTVLPEAVDTPIFHHAANYTDSEIRALPPAADPGRVVDAVLGCIQHPKPEVTVGLAGRAMTFGQRTLRKLALPRAYDWASLRAMDLVAFRNQPSAGPSHSNVFAPQPELNHVDGGWRAERSTSRRVAAVAAGGAALVPLVAWWRRT